jgi:transposase
MQTIQAPVKPQIRTFSEEFKKAKIKELDEKLISIQELVTSYKISRTSVYKWLIKYSIHYQKGTKMVIELESEAQKTKQLLQEKAELQRALGEKQMQLDLLNKLIEFASDDLRIDLKKSFQEKLSTSLD